MLNTLKIRNLKSKGCPYRVADHNGPCKGLGIHISAKGHKSFHLGMRINGKRRYWKIGDAANTPLSDARKEGLALRKLIEKGEDPREISESTVATVEELCEGYIQNLKDRGKKCWADAKRAFDIDCKPLYKKPANEVTSAEIADAIRIVVKRGSLGQANRVRAYLQAAYNWGMSADLDTTQEQNGSQFQIATNPVSPIPKPQKGCNALDRWLTEAEIKQVWGVLPNYTSMTATSALRLMLCTGQRTNEVLGMEWTEIVDDVWTIPEHKTKNGKTHEVVLNSLALSVVEEVKKLTGKCTVMFPQRQANKTVMESNTLSHATRRLCAGEKMIRFTPRDLRRTFKSMALKHGLQKEILDKAQNHAQHDVSSRHYVKYEFLNEKREAMILWNEALREILK